MRDGVLSAPPGVDFLNDLQPGSPTSLFWTVVLVLGLVLAVVFAIVAAFARESRSTWLHASAVALASPVAAVLLSSVATRA